MEAIPEGAERGVGMVLRMTWMLGMLCAEQSGSSRYLQNVRNVRMHKKSVNKDNAGAP